MGAFYSAALYLFDPFKRLKRTKDQCTLTDVNLVRLWPVALSMACNYFPCFQNNEAACVCVAAYVCIMLLISSLEQQLWTKLILCPF